MHGSLSKHRPAPTASATDALSQRAVASVGSRSAAYIFDMLLLFVGWLLIASVAAIRHPGQLPSPGTLLWVVGGWLTSQVLMFSLQEALCGGQTRGKQLLGIRVVDAHGAAPGPGRCLIRNLLRPIDNLPFGCTLGTILVAGSPRAQRLGDRVAGTFVVQDPPTGTAIPPLRLPDDCTSSEQAILHTWVARGPGLEQTARLQLARRIQTWMDQRWPGHLPPGPDALARLQSGLQPQTDP